MGAYTKPWLQLDDQVDKLEASGVDVEPRDRTLRLLAAVGYYRLSGYLYPFRDSLRVVDEAGRARTSVLDTYRPGTSIVHAVRVIDFDRRLRGLVMDGVDRIEVAVRMRVGYVLGRRSPLAHLDPATFHPAFVVPRLEPAGGWPTVPSRHADWLHRVARRRDASDEAFVAHFRERYDGEMPVWALTLLDHLRLSSNPKTSNGTYGALAVMAYLLRSVDGSADWTARAAALLDEFPAVDGLPLTVTGAPPNRERLDLWRAEVGS
jgi:abortive infection bacteriophage resistance protein